MWTLKCWLEILFHLYTDYHILWWVFDLQPFTSYELCCNQWKYTSYSIERVCVCGGESHWGSTETRRDYIKMEAHCTESQQMKIRKTWKQKKKKVSVFTLTIQAIPSLSTDIQRNRNRRETLQAEERGTHLCPWCSCTYQSWLTRAW